MDIITLKVEVATYDRVAGKVSIIEPVFECAGEAKFDEFAKWYDENLSSGQVATLKGYAHGRLLIKSRFVSKL